MGTLRTRRQKISWIKGTLEHLFQSGADFVALDVFLANFAYANDSTERTGRDILKLMEKMGEISIKGNEILKEDLK